MEIVGGVGDGGTLTQPVVLNSSSHVMDPEGAGQEASAPVKIGMVGINGGD